MSQLSDSLNMLNDGFKPRISIDKLNVGEKIKVYNFKRYSHRLYGDSIICETETNSLFLPKR